MLWMDVSLVSRRHEFVLLSKQEGVNIRARVMVSESARRQGANGLNGMKRNIELDSKTVHVSRTIFQRRQHLKWSPGFLLSGMHIRLGEAESCVLFWPTWDSAHRRRALTLSRPHNLTRGEVVTLAIHRQKCYLCVRTHVTRVTGL